MHNLYRMAAVPLALCLLGAPRWVHMVFSVPDPEVTYRALEVKGASLAARRSPNGHIQSFLITDSEGNEVEIIGASPK